MLLLFAYSCSGAGSGDRKLAQVGRYKLYESDIKGLYRPGISAEDSSSILSTYVRQWVLGKAKLVYAESELPKAERNVDRQVDDFRASLLVYKLEEMYLKSNIDTSVSNEELMNYYSSHSGQFTSTESVVKARFIRVRSDSPNLRRIESLYKSDDIEKSEELVGLCRNSADEYTDFGMEWVGLSKVAELLGVTPYEAESIFSGHMSYKKRDAFSTYFVYIFDIVSPGYALPYDYVEDKVKSRVLGRRNIELVKALDHEAMKYAYRDKRVKIYIDE